MERSIGCAGILSIDRRNVVAFLPITKSEKKKKYLLMCVVVCFFFFYCPHNSLQTDDKSRPTSVWQRMRSKLKSAVKSSWFNICSIGASSTSRLVLPLPTCLFHLSSHNCVKCCCACCVSWCSWFIRQS